MGSAVSSPPWWTAHSSLFTDVRDAAGLEALLTTHKDKVVVLEWLSPTCKVCFPAPLWWWHLTATETRPLSTLCALTVHLTVLTPHQALRGGSEHDGDSGCLDGAER